VVCTPKTATHPSTNQARRRVTFLIRPTTLPLHHAATIGIKKGKGFPHSTPSVGPGADPGVHAVSLQVTVSHPPGDRLPLLSTRPAVTSSAAEHHRPLAGTKLCCLLTEAHRCKQLAQGWYAALPRAGFEPATYWSHRRYTLYNYSGTATWVKMVSACFKKGREWLGEKMHGLWSGRCKT